MRRRWKLRLLWAAVLFGVLLLAIPASVAQATAAVEGNLRRTVMRVGGREDGAEPAVIDG